MKWLLDILGSSLLKDITRQLGEAYEAKLKASTDKERLEAEKTIFQLEARQQLLIVEQGRWMTAWIRPMIALPIVIFIWKIVVYDTVLGWGSTPYPGQFVEYLVYTVVGAYMLTRPFERR
jgi:hypothetical protein